MACLHAAAGGAEGVGRVVGYEAVDEQAAADARYECCCGAYDGEAQTHE